MAPRNQLDRPSPIRELPYFLGAARTARRIFFGPYQYYRAYRTGVGRGTIGLRLILLGGGDTPYWDFRTMGEQKTNQRANNPLLDRGKRRRLA